MRTLASSLLLTIAVISSAPAQQPQQGPHDGLIRDPYIAPTGATVDKPGLPQGSAPTALDRDIRREDKAIDRSVCKGC